MRIKRMDEKLFESEKPSLTSITDFALSEGDALVICAGFEERAKASLSRIPDQKNDTKIVLLDYRPNNLENHFSEILALCKTKAAEVHTLVYDRENPQGFFEKLSQQFGEISGNLYIDISGMSRLLIVQIMVGLKHRAYKKTFCLYAEAQSYPPSFEEAEKVASSDDLLGTMILVSSGVLEVCVVPELSSVSMQGQPTRLITFPSFNVAQLSSLIAFIQPPFITLLHGIPPDSSLSWRPEILKRLNRTSDYLSENFDVSTLDYRDTLSTLLQTYSKHGVTEQLVIAPVGSKMQALAVGLFRAFLGDIQIVYPLTQHFAAPDGYTQGVKQLYQLSLEPFGELVP